jgi:hypothetical protein
MLNNKNFVYLQGFLVRLDFQAHLDQLVLQVKLECRAGLAKREPWAVQESRARPDLKEFRDFRVIVDLLERLEIQEQQEPQDKLDFKVLRDLQVIGVL